MITVKFGNLKTTITQEMLQEYLDSGWEVVEAEKRPETEYDKFNDMKLNEVLLSRGLVPDESREENIKALELLDEVQFRKAKPTNEGFTDNLIKQ